MWKEKVGSYLIDISKYVITAVVITSMFKDIDNKLAIYICGILFSAVALMTGLVLTNKKEKEK